MMNTYTPQSSDRTIPMVLLIFLCFLLLRLSIFHPTLMPGGDLYWHLEYGNSILDNKALPEVDWLSWTYAGKPYMITQWLGEVLMALAVRAGGPFGLAVLVTLSSCLTLFFSWRTVLIYVRNPAVALGLALITVMPVVLGMNGRPQIFGITAFSALVWVLATWFETKARWTLVAMVGIMVIWVNLHGSFVVGLLYIAALAGGAWIATFAEKKGRFVESVSAHLPLAIASFVALLAVLINPYGWNAFVYVAQIAQLKTTTSGFIAEWLPTSFSTTNGAAFFSIVAVVFVAMALKKERPTLQMILTFLGVVYFGMSADRQVLVAMVALVPIFAQSLQGSWVLSKLEGEVALQVRLVKGIVVVMLAVVAALSMHSLSKLAIEHDYHYTYPDKAIDFIAENKIEGKLFHHFAQGGYIAHRGYKSWMDGRLDLFGDDFSMGVTSAIDGKAGWQAYLDAYKPDLFILRNNAPLVNLLLIERKCVKIYGDINHSIIQCKDFN